MSPMSSVSMKDMGLHYLGLTDSELRTFLWQK